MCPCRVYFVKKRIRCSQTEPSNGRMGGCDGKGDEEGGPRGVILGPGGTKSAREEGKGH
jgi:hypothetical protein